MAFSIELKEQIQEYVYGHLPAEDWYDKTFIHLLRTLRYEKD